MGEQFYYFSLRIFDIPKSQFSFLITLQLYPTQKATHTELAPAAILLHTMCYFNTIFHLCHLVNSHPTFKS